MIDTEKFRNEPGFEKPKPHRVVTVRMSIEMHQQLKRLAHQEQVSMNQLCIASFEETARQLDRTPALETAGQD